MNYAECLLANWLTGWQWIQLLGGNSGKLGLLTCWQLTAFSSMLCIWRNRGHVCYVRRYLWYQALGAGNPKKELCMSFNIWISQKSNKSRNTQGVKGSTLSVKSNSLSWIQNCSGRQCKGQKAHCLSTRQGSVGVCRLPDLTITQFTRRGKVGKSLMICIVFKSQLMDNLVWLWVIFEK